MAYINAIKYNRIRSMKGLPIGAIIPWSADQSSVPTGWVVCNGSIISIKSYPLLYEIIGNTYGGTVGSTYKLPPLTNSGKSVMDIFIGHYEWLKNRGEDAHSPQTNTISESEDPFWNIVKNGNGDEGSTQRDSWTSTFDVVGEFAGSPNFFGLYDNMTVSEGTYTYVAVWSQERLYSYHLTPHSHFADSGNNAQSYANGTANANECLGNVPEREGDCRINCGTTTAWRVAAKPQNSGGRVWTGDNQTDLENNFLDTHTWRRNGGGSAIGTGGGGQIQSTPPGEFGNPGEGFGESGSTVYDGGDGRCSGDMNCNTDVLFTSLSNSEKTISSVGPHEHGVTTFNLSGKYRPVSPGLRSDIKLNTVTINNEPGRNAGTIEATTSTPSLEMVYIIRAY